MSLRCSKHASLRPSSLMQHPQPDSVYLPARAVATNDSLRSTAAIGPCEHPTIRFHTGTFEPSRRRRHVMLSWDEFDKEEEGEVAA
ncbi:hypothetical protein, partial [Pseudomonas sp. HMWF034]|uniref:hypothetical protein n=1 Tax=Pseudomonas sp. HMWF034 TaxID=2056867 RepID=UPI001C4540C3